MTSHHLSPCQPVFTLLPSTGPKCCCLLTNTLHRNHITPIFCSLHWFPVWFGIDSKLLLFVFKAINDLAPSYLSETLSFRQHNRALRSSGLFLLEVPRSRYKQWGDHAFTMAAPSLWNIFPPDLCAVNDLALFTSKLQTYLLRMAFNI